MVRDTFFYDRLGVTPTATSSDIRRAYYARARACHPDKHPGDAAKEQEFKALSEAYQTLFDEDRRKAYDEYGKAGLEGGAASGAYADPREVFAAVFGGPEFEPLVGVLGDQPDEAVQRAAHEAAAALHAKQQEQARLRADPGTTPEQHAACQAEVAALAFEAEETRRALEGAALELQRGRVASVAAALQARIAPHVAGEHEAFRAQAEADAARLRGCAMGGRMLAAVGYAYVRETQKALGTGGALGLGLGHLVEEVVEGGHKFSEVVTGVGSAMGIASVHVKLARDAHPDAPATARLAPEQRAALLEKMQRHTLDLVWTLTKRDIENTVRAAVGTVLEHGRAAAPPPGAPPLLSVVVPAGVRPGQRMRVAPPNGAQFEVEVPAGVHAGQAFQCRAGAGAGGAAVCAITPTERQRRAEALLLLGRVFQGDSALDRNVDGINKFARDAERGLHEFGTSVGRLFGLTPAPQR